MNKIIVSFAALALPLYAHATNFDQLLDQSGGRQVKFGVASPGFSRNVDVQFAPASNSKMFTALALLERMGGNSTIPTVVRWAQIGASGAAGLQVIGYGDPSWGLGELGENSTTRVDRLAQALWDAGVRQVYGAITTAAGDPRFENLRYPEGWLADDPNTCEGALAQAFNLNLNCASYRLNSPTSGQWLQSGVADPIQLQVSSGSRTRIVVGLADPRQPAKGFIVRGTLQKGASSSFALPVLNAKDWVRNLFVAALKKRGVILNPVEAPATGAAHTVTVNSPTLALIVKAMMKNSINMIGDGLFKILASNYAQPAGPDLVTGGQNYLRQFLLNTGAPDRFVVYDGAGLSRQSRVTPKVMYAFLNYAKDSREFKAFFNALPIAGVDGTLHARMRGTAAAKRLRAKTGTLNGVYNLSGFVPSGNTYIPFVLLTSTTVAGRFAARAAEDRFGAALANTLHREFTPAVEEAPFPFVPEHAGQDAQ